MAKTIAAGNNRISMNQFIASAVAEKVSALNTESYLQERAARASATQFNAALEAVLGKEMEGFDVPK